MIALSDSDKKTTDLSLTLIAIAVGILLWLIPKNALTISISLLVIWALLAHPIWHWSLVRVARRRQVSSLIICALGLVVIGYSVWPAPRTKAFLQIEKPEILQQFSHIAPGKQFGGNIRAVNRGQERIFKAFGYSQSYVKVVAIDTDDQVIEAFEQEIEPIKKLYFSGGLSGPEKGIDQYIWNTVVTPPLTQQEIRGIIDGSVRIYFVSWVGWRDAEGTADSAFDCRWLQKFERFPYSQKDIVWHFCT